MCSSSSLYAILSIYKSVQSINSPPNPLNHPLENINRFFDRVVSSAAQGSVAAVVGAGLGAVAEPVVNTVLVKRVPVNVALKEFSKERAWKMFWQATLPTNMIKFPFYEVINMILKEMSLPETGKGAITGAIFTTATLPLGNYRFMKSMNMEITIEGLWKAYLPTLLRDVIYGIVRPILLLLSNIDQTSTTNTGTIQHVRCDRSNVSESFEHCGRTLLGHVSHCSDSVYCFITG